MLFIDIETFSDIDLKKSNVYRYSESDAFRILMAAWTTDGVEYHVAIGHDEIREIPGLFDPSVMKCAHNAPFERICFSRLADTEFLPPEDWEDTRALAGEAGYPQSLAKLAVALGAEEKDSAGTHLINWFCKPNRNGERRLPEDHPEKWQAFVEYCIQDVRTLFDVYHRLPDWPTKLEREVYLTCQRINDRGIVIDTDMARAAVQAAEQNRAEQVAEMRALTGVENPGSVQQLLGWFRDTGTELPNLQRATIEKALQDATVVSQRRVLELRQDLALVASKKYTAALSGVSHDSRLRGSFFFYGAHTGRWAGRGAQLQNLPRAQALSESDAIERIRARDGEPDKDLIRAEQAAVERAAILDLQIGNGASNQTLKALVRPMFVVNGSVIDFSQIEARVLAWFAGEQWKLDVFRAGRDIYVEIAERMSTSAKTMTRQDGKVAELALGFGGTTGALERMGAEGSEEYKQMLVTQWRKTNPRICRLWKALDAACRRPGRQVGRIRVTREDGDIKLWLPSGRPLTYHNVKFEPNGPEDQWSNMTFDDPKGFRARAWYGTLIENIVQATARDVHAEALVRLDRADIAVVGHVHDEVIVEGASVKEVSDIMCESPEWADGLPLATEGFETYRYMKG